jgi:hypothetical protein
MRYEIHPIADETCSSLNPKVLASTDDEHEATLMAAQYSGYPYGAGILNTVTGEIDVGFGFGVLCPDFDI